FQAKSASFADLGTAVQTAAKTPGVVAISNSYGGSDAADATYGKYYNFQAKSASFADLGTAVQTAAKTPGVVAISNSYGG
ncbi:peptidase S8, partial [Methylobacterium radiotolerans]